MTLTDVGSRASVLEVSEALSTNVAGNTNRRATVGNTRCEGANVTGLMAASETEVIVLAVHGDVLIVPLGQLLDRSFNRLDTSGLTHLLGAEVGVAASTVPVAGERFRVEGHLDTPLLGDTDEEVACHPEVVAHGDTLTRADLELPLRWHDLGVDTRDVDASVQTSAVVGLNQVTRKDLPGT